jgi:phenylpropionate dioxygenase-like ring-hydroxylating dioxygenase large terminal subunit
LDRSFRLVFKAAGVMTALASSVSITERMAIAPVVRSVTVLPWWVRPRAAIRFHAPMSRSPCQPQEWQMAHFQPSVVGRSGAFDGDRRLFEQLSAWDPAE